VSQTLGPEVEPVRREFCSAMRWIGDKLYLRETCRLFVTVRPQAPTWHFRTNSVDPRYQTSNDDQQIARWVGRTTYDFGPSKVGALEHLEPRPVGGFSFLQSHRVLHIRDVCIELAIIVMSRSSYACEDRFDSIKLSFPDVVPRRFGSEICDDEQWNWKDPLCRVWSSPSPIAFDFGNSS
jgi:hypothetical protein